MSIKKSFNKFIQAPLFSYIARKCRTDDEMITVIRKYIYLLYSLILTVPILKNMVIYYIIV